jgi:hypothetical protein
MKIKHYARIVTAILIFSVSSCFVSLPTEGTKITSEYHGQLLTLDRSIDISNGYNSNFAWEHPADENIGPRQHILATIPAGTALQGLRTVAARLPAGIENSLKCYSPDHDISFEIRESKLEKWGAKIITKKIENKAQMATPRKPSD